MKSVRVWEGEGSEETGLLIELAFSKLQWNYLERGGGDVIFNMYMFTVYFHVYFAGGSGLPVSSYVAFPHTISI